MLHASLARPCASSRERASALPPTPSSPSWILVVDDDPCIREVIQIALEEEGHEVTTACNGREALACLAESSAGKKTVVLLDLNMPVMTGWECIEQITQLPLPPPVIIMTAGSAAQQEATRRGAAGYLAKPFDLDELGGMVQRLLSDCTHAAAPRVQLSD